MQFNTVLEAVIRDKNDQYKNFDMEFYPEGRLKHVKENIQTHVLNFARSKRDGLDVIVSSYYKKEIIYRPENEDEVYVTKKNIDIKYDEETLKPVSRQFKTFSEFHAFVLQEYENGNHILYDLMKKFLNRAWVEYGNMDISTKRKEPNYFDTIIFQDKRLENAIRWLFKKHKISNVQEYVIILKYHKYKNIEKWGENIGNDPKKFADSLFQKIEKSA